MWQRSVATVAAALVALALARDAAALPPAERDWDAQIELYAWAASLSVDAEVKGVVTEVDQGFFDVLGDLGWAVFGRAEGRWKRGLLLLDGMGMQLVEDGSATVHTVPLDLRNGTQGALSIGGVDAHSRITEGMFDAKLGLRALSLPLRKLCGKADDPTDLRRFDVDLLAGLRYWDVTVKTKLSVPPASLTVGGNPVTLPGILPDLDLGHVRVPGVFLRGAATTVDAERQWVDPLVGVRLRADVTQHISMYLMGDIGGWGGGGDDHSSELTWQGTLGGQWNFGEHWAATASYRALGVNRGTALKNMITYGPQFGIAFRF